MRSVSTARALVAVLLWVGGAPGVVWLISLGRLVLAVAVAVALLLHAAAEVVAWEIRDLRAARLRREAMRSAAGPLTGYCPQVTDRYVEELERRSQSMHRPRRGVA